MTPEGVTTRPLRSVKSGWSFIEHPPGSQQRDRSGSAWVAGAAGGRDRVRRMAELARVRHRRVAPRHRPPLLHTLTVDPKQDREDHYADSDGELRLGPVAGEVGAPGAERRQDQ